MQELAAEQLETASEYWKALSGLPTVRRVDTKPRKFLLKAMPAGELKVRIVHRLGGLGSLGRPRFTALATWRGGLVAREAKALTGSAWYWRGTGRTSRHADRIRYNIHLGSHQRVAILRDLKARKGRWLERAAKSMATATASDWKEWKRAQ
ncbi:MAG: hypothetical protein ABI885_23160 [Gammaproteobacteria bacterium]